jgi:pimeloyl-ACP methyl ester carboxylesterase
VLLAPAGFGRIALAEAVSVPEVRELVQLALPLVLRHRLPLNVAYRSAVTNNQTPAREVLDRFTEHVGSLVPAPPGDRSRRRRRARSVRSTVAGSRTTVRSRRSGGRATASFRRVTVQESARRFPHAETVEWTGMGHHPQRERLEDLLEFVTGACAHAPSQAQAPARVVPVPPRSRRLASALPVAA